MNLKDRHHLDTSKVDDIVLGCVDAYCMTKVVILPKLLQLPQVGTMMLPVCKLTVSVHQVLEAVNMAAQKVRSGWEDVVVAGGVESMSRIANGFRWWPMGIRP